MIGRKQKGLMLASAGIFLLLISIAVTYALVVYSQKNKDKLVVNRAEQVGERLAVLGDGVKNYATQYFVQIQRGEKADSVNGSYSVPADRVRNPTLEDLYLVGALTNSESIRPIEFRGQNISFDVEFSVNTSGCVIPSCNIQALITSTNPLMNEDGTQADARLATIAAQTASKENAGVSLPLNMGADPSEFVSLNGVRLADNPTGVAGLLAMRAAYDSKGFMEFDRRDGSLPRTGNLRLKDDLGNKHDITGASTVEVGKFIDLSEALVVAKGQPCDKTGLVSRNDKGKLMSCQNGIWGEATDSVSAENNSCQQLNQRQSSYAPRSCGPGWYVNGVGEGWTTTQILCCPFVEGTPFQPGPDYGGH